MLRRRDKFLVVRKKYLEHGSRRLSRPPGLAPDVNHPPVLENDLMAHPQPETRASGVLGGEVLRPVARYTATGRNANGELVALQFVNAVLLFANSNRRS